MKNIDQNTLSPELVLCVRPAGDASRRRYHPERTCVFYEVTLVQDKPDVHTVNGREYFAYPDDMIFTKPGDKVLSYSYGTNFLIIFSPYPQQEGKAENCEFLDAVKTHIMTGSGSNGNCQDMIREIAATADEPALCAPVRTKALLSYLIFLLCEKGSQTDETIKKSAGYIDANILSGIPVSDIIRESGISSSYYHRLFRLTYGLTPVEYINRQKLRYARDRLLEKDIKTSELSATLGFESVSYFCSIFRKAYGYTPKEFAAYFAGQR